jgi:diguanylate cyclase
MVLSGSKVLRLPDRPTVMPILDTSPVARPTVLVVDDEPLILALLSQQLKDTYDVLLANSIATAQACFANRAIDVIVCDLNLGHENGLQLLEWVRTAGYSTARIMLSGTSYLADAVEAINRCHIHRLVLKPWQPPDLLAAIDGSFRTQMLERAHQKLLDEYRGLLLELETRVADRTRELEQKNQLLERMALTDALTSVPNRRAVELIARKELLRRIRTSEPLAIGLIDADHFKLINSTYLLTGGDYVLTWLGQTLQNTIRGSDSIGRIGGEEFMIVAPNTDAMGAAILAERLRTTVEQTRLDYNGRPIQLTISVGFVVIESINAVTLDELRMSASAALAEAKAQGRNCSIVRPHTPSPALALSGYDN